MRWTGGRRSDNIEDRRGMGGGTLVAGGGIGGLVLVLLALFFGIDPGVLLQSDEPPPAVQAPAGSPGRDDEKEFVAVVLGDTEDTWGDLFRQMGRYYRQPKLVLFTDAVQSACGMAGAAVGPFYCPSDQKLYLDLSFFRALRERFHAPGDFAQAYVIAHEVGHHVQTLLGITDNVPPPRQRGGQANAVSVRVELQADCLAGIWAHHAREARDILEEGDLEEALNAASAIGDDTLQRQARGRVMPESFTHGSSKQRVAWFARGFETGKLGQCDTFRASEL